MSLKIFYNGQWRAFEAPPHYLSEEGLKRYSESFNTHNPRQEYERDLSEAAKNSLPVLNEELITTDVIDHLPVPGEYYDWPGSWKKERRATVTKDGVAKYIRVYVLTLPAPVKEENTCSTCGKTWGDPDGMFCSNSFHLATPMIMKQIENQQNEIESLRSELSKKDEEIKQLRDALKQRDEEKAKDYDYQQLKEENAILNERLAKQSPSDKWIDGISRKYGEK